MCLRQEKFFCFFFQWTSVCATLATLDFFDFCQDKVEISGLGRSTPA